MKSKVLTIGEIMLRLQPPDNDRIRQANCFDAAFGGGEANVAVCLRQLGTESRFFTRLPDNEITAACIQELRKFGVDTSSVLFGGERIGLYYCEKGYGQRPSRVIYDRKHSAFAGIETSDIDWNGVFDDIRWLHITGITPALSDNTRRLTVSALKEAKNRGITVSCDLNYRSKLWSEAEARTVMEQLTGDIDVIIANEEDAEKVFGLRAVDSDVSAGNIDRDGYGDLCRQIEQKYGVHTVAVTLRESFSANRNGWSAILYDKGSLYHAKRYDIPILDRVGGGDSFCAGLIHAILRGDTFQNAIDYATACSCLKHSVNGDFHIISDKEVCELMRTGGNGRVQR